jgi:hypothetical protein
LGSDDVAAGARDPRPDRRRRLCRHPFINHIQASDEGVAVITMDVHKMRWFALTLNANYFMFCMSKLDGTVMLRIRC